MERARTSSSRGGWRTYLNPSSLPFWGIHVAAVVGVALLGWSWSGVLLAVLLYAIRMVFVTAGYHRYFSHRSFKTSRTFQFVLGFLAQTAMQRGVLWWAAHHRHHHRHSDTDNDVHSPARHGFWWAHLGWSASPTSNRFGADQVKDLARYPELRMLDRFKHAPGILLAVALFLVGGAHALVWGFLVSTVLLWHGTFTINSLSHVIGRRRYPTRDDSRNNWVLALITMGEGWHNNHHHYQGSARQGFFWWEIDVSFYILYCLEAIGVVWDLRRPPRRILDGAARQAPAHAAHAAVQIPGPMPLAPILGHEAE